MNHVKRKNKGLHARPLKNIKNQKTLKKLALAIAIVFVATVTYIKFLAPHTYDAKQRVKLENTLQQLNSTKKAAETQKIESQTQADEQKKLLDETNKKLEETQKALEAKRAIPRVYAAELPSAPITGDKNTWMTQAGIPASEWWAVDYIVTRESGWRPDALGSMTELGRACGLVQALPCSKLGPNWNDPVTALKWQAIYVANRYGGYAGAVEYWKIHGNY